MGLEKFDGPLAPPPPFLSPSAELKGWKRPSIPTELFEPYIVDQLLQLDLTIEQAFDVGANVVSEVGWDESYAYYNLGGVKATKGWAERYKARTGRDAPWWRTHGNKGTGDSQTVFYRGYTSISDCLEEWLVTFVPKPGTVGDVHLYKKTGELFWAGDEKWFAEMVRAGYKGPVTAKNPDGAVSAHRSIMSRLRTVWAQARLGLVVDAKWGPKSAAACKAFQYQHGLTQSGVADAETCELLAIRTSPRIV